MNLQQKYISFTKEFQTEAMRGEKRRYFSGDPSAKSYQNYFLPCDYDWGQPDNKVLLS